MIHSCYRKPTITNTTTKYLSNHPPNRTQSRGTQILYRKMINLPFKNNNQQDNEWHTILHIAKANNFPSTLIHKLNQKIPHKIMYTTPPANTHNNMKWATFTFSSPHIRRITNLFKHTNLKTTFRYHNTITRLTKPEPDHKIPSHNKGGIYQLSCKTCNLSYVGQASRSLKTRYQEHIRYFRTNNPQSIYAQHILHNQHEYDAIHDLRTLLIPLRNANMLIPYQQFHIQFLHQTGKLISGQSPGEPNPLFQLAIHPP